MDEQTIRTLLLQHNYQYLSSRIITTGKFNRSFAVEIEPKIIKGKEINQLILRIAPPDDSGFIFYERGMMRQEPGLHQVILENTNLPVPVIFHNDFSRKLIDQDYLIMEFMPGQPLSSVSLSRQQHDRVMNQTGKYLAELHRHCKAADYGYLGEHQCMQPQNNWRSAFEIMWMKMIEDNRKCGVYTKEDADLAKNALKTNLQVFDFDLPPSLLHMDIWGQNILIDSHGNISAILDWDRALWGDPEIEYAVLDYCGFNNEAFWAGYGNQPEQTHESEIRRIFYHLYETQKYQIIWTVRRPDPSGVDSYKQYALQALKSLG